MYCVCTVIFWYLSICVVFVDIWLFVWLLAVWNSEVAPVVTGAAPSDSSSGSALRSAVEAGPGSDRVCLRCGFPCSSDTRCSTIITTGRLCAGVVLSSPRVPALVVVWKWLLHVNTVNIQIRFEIGILLRSGVLTVWRRLVPAVRRTLSAAWQPQVLHVLTARSLRE